MTKLNGYNNGTNPAAKQLDIALADLRRRFGADVIRPASEIQPPAVIPTGFAELDQALGIGGLPCGRIVDIYGPESAGKTTLALHVIAQAQRVQTPDALRASGVASRHAAFIDAEHKLDPTWAAAHGVDLARLMVLQPTTAEQALEITDGLVRSGQFAVIVIDSTAALVPKAEVEGEMGDNHQGLQAVQMSQACRKLAGPARETGTLIIFISQLRHKIGVLFGSPETPTGGAALRFYATIRIELRRQQALKRGNRVTGSRVRAVIKKNQLAPPFLSAEFDLLWEGR